ncbi:MAG: ACT domain-containing protein, partial [Fimbriimonadaceae bacterium]|nr:ACT domain-containing protein [Fimbriimonadaceae bacterium]
WVQGRLPGGELNTLGRGGSDTTASAVGAALQADAVESDTDVDGVKTADPDFVPGAPTLREVTYDEVAEIAHLGAKVVHPRAAEIAMKFNIPLWVKNTFTDDPGTEIVSRDRSPGRRATGVTHTGKLVSCQMDLTMVDQARRTGFEAAIYRMLARYGFNLYMINLSPSGLGWAVPREQFGTVIDLFDGLVMPDPSNPGHVFIVQVGERPSKGAQTQIDLMEGLGKTTVVPMEISEGCTMVSLVGQDFVHRPGLFLEILEMMDEESISVIQTSDSDSSVSFLIPEAELRRAVALIHRRFELGGLA